MRARARARATRARRRRGSARAATRLPSPLCDRKTLGDPKTGDDDVPKRSRAEERKALAPLEVCPERLDGAVETLQVYDGRLTTRLTKALVNAVRMPVGIPWCIWGA